MVENILAKREMLVTIFFFSHNVFLRLFRQECHSRHRVVNNLTHSQTFYYRPVFSNKRVVSLQIKLKIYILDNVAIKIRLNILFRRTLLNPFFSLYHERGTVSQNSVFPVFAWLILFTDRIIRHITISPFYTGILIIGT